MALIYSPVKLWLQCRKSFWGEDDGKGSLLNKTVVIPIEGGQRPPLQVKRSRGSVQDYVGNGLW